MILINPKIRSQAVVWYIISHFDADLLLWQDSNDSRNNTVSRER